MKWLLLVLSFVTLSFAQSEEYKAFLMELKPQIEAAHYSSSVEAMLNLNAQAERLVTFDETVWYGYYYQGFILNDLGSRLLNQDEDKAKEYLELAVEKLEKANELNENEDVSVLIANALGKLIGMSPMKGMFLGPKSGALISKGYDINPNNPHVLIADAISKMFTPSMFGGDKEKSRELLVRVLELNKTYVSEDEFRINWREADAFVWLAQLDIMNKNKVAATENLNKALEIQPEYGHAKAMLNYNQK